MEPFYIPQTGVFADETILPSGLEFKTDITGRDASKWAVVGWFYNGIFYADIAAFRKAWKTKGFVKPGPPVDGAWGSTDWNGQQMPHDNLNPPVSVQPDGTRFSLDPEQKYVEWSK